MATIASLLAKLPRMWTGTKTQYDAITTKSDYTLYFITDTHEIYKGMEVFSDASEAPGNKMDKLDSTTAANKIVLTAGTTGNVVASSVEINTSTITSTTSKVPTDKTVKDYVDTTAAGKVDKFNGTASNLVVAVGGTASNVQDAGVSIGGATLGNSATKVAREDAVSTALTGKMDLITGVDSQYQSATVGTPIVTVAIGGGQAGMTSTAGGENVFNVIDRSDTNPWAYTLDTDYDSVTLATIDMTMSAAKVYQYSDGSWNEGGNYTEGVNGHVVVVQDGRTADTGITIVSGTTSNSDTVLATTAFVMSKVSAGTSDKMDKLSTSTAGNLVTAVGGASSNVQDAGVALNKTAAFAGTANTISTDDLVKTYVDNSISTAANGKLDKFAPATISTIVLVSGTGTSVTGSEYTINGTDVTLTGGSTSVPSAYAVKTYVDGKISGLGNVFAFKGTKATKSALPSSGNATGDVWIVTADETYSPAKSNVEYVWTGSAWEELGGNVNPNLYTTKQNANAGEIVTFVGGDASDIQTSGKTITTSVNNNDTTVPTGKAVTSAISTAVSDSANTKVDKFNGTAGHIVTAVGGTASNVQDSNVSINSGALGTTTSTVPTDKTVYDEFAALIEALAWQEPT